MSRRINKESGLTMVLVVTVLAALLAGGAVALVLQLGSTKEAGLVKGKRAAMYCAEAGLAAARNTVQANFPLWAELIDADASNDPSWYPIEGDIDTPPDGTSDFIVTVRDDEDESPSANDPTVNVNQAVVIVSRCTKYPDTPAELLEIVTLDGSTHCYGNQKGGCATKSGNLNVSGAL